jgi:TorA maturation chaperone TorD
VSDKGKTFLCQVLSSLFHPPDQGTVEQVSRGHLYGFFKKALQSWRGEIEIILKGFLTESPPSMLLQELKDDYNRLFSDTGNQRISLVESFYKPWTQDPHCSLPFAKERGFHMGDSAVHLSILFGQCGVEVSGPFKGMPDHIVIELEFLSYLYQEAGDREIKRFIEDHLDWIHFLRETFERGHAHPFYVSLIEVLDLFINLEKKRLEEETDGKKDIRPEVV